MHASKNLKLSGFYVFCIEIFFRDEWHVLTGNELGGLLGWWMLHTYRVRCPDDNSTDAYMLASTVSSKILASMAKKEDFQFEVRQKKKN